MKTWITKNNEEIPFNELEDSHLLNIIKYIRQKAKEGIQIVSAFGYDGDDDFMSGDIEELYGKDVLKYYDYNELFKEARKRKLIV